MFLDGRSYEQVDYLFNNPKDVETEYVCLKKSTNVLFQQLEQAQVY